MRPSLSALMQFPPFFRKLARPAGLFAAFCGVLFLSGCWLDMDGPQSTMVVDGPVARDELHLFYVTVWVCLFIFVVVGGVLAYATLKFRAHTKEEENAEPPEQSHGNPLVEMSLIAASVFCLVIVAVPTLKAIWFTYDVPAAEKANALEVTATGSQWWFKFDYPQQGFVTANELVIPAGRAVHVNLRSADVMHSFWVPKLAGKVDMIPNRGNHLWLKSDKPGYFWGQCAEYCGESHAVMRFRVIALPENEFEAWVANQKKNARTVTAASVAAAEQPRIQLASAKLDDFPKAGWTAAFDESPLAHWRQDQLPNPDENPALVAQGRKLFLEKTCVGCHTVRGQEGVGITGPDLTHVGARSTIAGGLLENNPLNLRHWIMHPGSVKPGNKMWETGYIPNNIHISDSEATALIAYLESLK